MRIGFGYDAHRLAAGRKCILCGVEIPSPLGPHGHSDADAPVHALIDAMLGALALGDIGTLFPDSDSRYEMADSIELLKKVYCLVNENGYILSNADITIILQSPHLGQYIMQMRQKLAQALDTEIGAISVKATTEEKMGFTGDGTGIACTAVAALTVRCVP